MCASPLPRQSSKAAQSRQADDSFGVGGVLPRTTFPDAFIVGTHSPTRRFTSPVLSTTSNNVVALPPKRYSRLSSARLAFVIGTPARSKIIAV